MEDQQKAETHKKILSYFKDAQGNSEGSIKEEQREDQSDQNIMTQESS